MMTMQQFPSWRIPELSGKKTTAMDSCIRSFDGRTLYATGFRFCPHCGCVEIKKNGNPKSGRQRWICSGCHSTFTGRTGTILFSSKLKPMLLKNMFSLLLDGTALR